MSKTTCCPPIKNGLTFSGFKSGNMSRSSGAECDPFPTCRPCAELPAQPFRGTHELTFCKCGVHKVPFFAVSRCLYNQFLAAQCESDHNDGAGASYVDVSGNPTINTNTFLPTPLANGVYQLFWSDGAPTPTWTVSTNGAVDVTSAATDAVLDVVIPKTSEAGVVVDLTDVTTFADSIYSTWNPAVADSVAGTLQPAVCGLAAGAVPDASGVVPPADSTPLVDGVLSNETLNACRLLNKPRVNVFNRSNCPAYLRVGKDGCTFESVSHQLGVRPNTRVTVEYNPQVKEWALLDTNARA